MHWLSASLATLSALTQAFGQQCSCSEGRTLLCEKSVALTLAQPCVRQCVQFEKPVHKGSLEEEHPCTVREDVLSRSRPAYLVDILYHPCYCVNTEQIKPVCSTHFVTFLNECAMSCIRQGAAKSHDGACVPQTNELSCGACLKHFHPMCGTDGKTYSNDCVFHCFKKENNIQDLAVKHDGACYPHDSPYVTATIQKRGGQKKQEELGQPNLERWLLSMIDFDRGTKKKKIQRIDIYS